MQNPQCLLCLVIYVPFCTIWIDHMDAFDCFKENITGGEASVGNGRDDSQRGCFVINNTANTVIVMNHGYDCHMSWWFVNTQPSLRSIFSQVQEFWQSVTWFWGGEAILEERPGNSVKPDWRAEVKEQVDKKTDTMEQQAMLQEKVAEKIWDLRRWLLVLSTKNFLLKAGIFRARVREGGRKII